MEVNQLWPIHAENVLKNKNVNVSKLEKRFDVLFPWSENYNTRRIFYSYKVQELPLFIIIVHHKKDILGALNLAKNKNLTIRIVSGHHSQNLQNPDFYLDMTDYNKIKLKKSILTVQGGITQGMIYNFLKNHESGYTNVHCAKIGHPLYSYSLACHLKNTGNTELVFPGGSALTVGASGLTTGGGIGSLKRTFSIAIDSVTNFQIVVPPNEADKARILDVKPGDDLFWALCGGVGSNFGVVTKISYDLPKVKKIILYSLSWPWSVETAINVIETWLNTAPHRNNQYNEDIGLSSFNMNGEKTLSVHVGGVYVLREDETTDEAKMAITQQLDNLGGNLVLQITDFHGTIDQLASNRYYYPYSSTRIFFSKNKLSAESMVNSIIEASVLNGLYLFGIELLGGKISEKSSKADAFYPRKAQYFYDIFTFAESNLDVDSITKWSTDTFHKFYNPRSDTVFVGFPITGLPDPAYSYFGKNSKRLKQIKQQYDPLGIMDYPQGLIN